MASTQYIVPIFLNKKDEPAFRTALAKYLQREKYTRDYHLHILESLENPAAIPGAAKQEYVELRLSCTDVLALFRFGEFWGNKTMQSWERELNQGLKELKGGPAGV